MVIYGSVTCLVEVLVNLRTKIQIFVDKTQVEFVANLMELESHITVNSPNQQGATGHPEVTVFTHVV